MKELLLILILCWPFGHRRNFAPTAPRVAAGGHWEQTPHVSDGYWREYVYAKQPGKPEPNLIPVEEAPPHRYGKEYPFHRYVWEWPGYKQGDKTVIVEDFPGKKQASPKEWIWLPDYDPFAPGQRYNL